MHGRNRSFLWPFLAIFLTAQANSGHADTCDKQGSYALKILRNTQPTKEYLVQLTCRGEGYIFESDVQETIEAVLSSQPDKSDTYQVTVAEGKLGWQKFEAKLEIKKDGDMLLLGNYGVDLRLHKLNDLSAPTIYSGAWAAPFLATRQMSQTAMKKKILGNFGDYRRGHIRGRLHTGIDIQSEWGAEVFPAAPGRVDYVSNEAPEGSVIIRHLLPGNLVIFTHYAHIKDPSVRVGQLVESHTRIARIFNEAEFKKSGFPYNHVHFEIRKSYADKGKASTNAKTQKYLNEYFFDPESFLLNHAK